MAFIVEIPVDSGGYLLVEAREDDLASTLELASLRPGEVAVRARKSVEAAIEQIGPAVSAVTNKLREMSADEITVEFGISLGLETAAVITRGTAGVHFIVRLNWKKPTGASAEGCALCLHLHLRPSSSGSLALIADLWA